MVSLTAPMPRPGGLPLPQSSSSSSSTAAAALQRKRKSNIPLSSTTTSPSISTSNISPKEPGRKRTGSQAGMDVDIPGPPSSPTKRSRVQFASVLDHTTPEETDKPIDLIREEVLRALNRQKKYGDSAEYSALKKAFQQENSNNGQSSLGLPSRRRLLQTFARLPMEFNRQVRDLVDAVLESDWVVLDAEYVDIFARFVVNLVSAQSAVISTVLDMLVGKFARPLAISSASSSSSSSQQAVSRIEAQRRIHSLIAQIVEIAPLDGGVALRKALQSLFPVDVDSTKAHILYTHNMLKVIEYAPQLETDILAVITDRVAKIDGQVQTDIEDLEDLDDILNGDSPQDLDTFMDSLEDEDEDDDDSDDEADMAEDGKSYELAKAIKGKIQKMDVLLDMLFEYYHNSMNASEALREAAYTVLEAHFDAIVLHSYRSRHVQFLIFHFAQTSLEFIDNFVGFCLQRTMDRNRPALLRHSAAAYLGSFVARGAHVPARVVRDVFSFIGDELTDLRAEYEPKCLGPDLRRFGTYYSLVQALLYIFCFRWRDLETTPSDPGSSPEPYSSATAMQDACSTNSDNNNLGIVGLPPSINNNSNSNKQQHQRHEFVFPTSVRMVLTRNVFSKLNPLKICAPVIAEEFAKVANDVGLLMAFGVLENNKRLRLHFAAGGAGSTGAGSSSFSSSVLGRETALSGSRDDAHFQLDAYFPFDPYHLPRSKRWLLGDYRDWEETVPPGGLDDRIEDDSSDEEDDDDEDDEDDDDDSSDEDDD